MRRRVLQVKNAVLHHLAVPGLILLIGIGSALAQSGDLRAQDQTKGPAANSAPSADAAKETQRKTDEFVEASQAINGPAGNPECVWLGRRVVVLMWRDDLDTAFRHLDLYDRFGCPGGHVQATFRLPGAFLQRDRSQGAGQPERTGPCLLDQSGGAAAGRRRGHTRPRYFRHGAGARCGGPRLPPLLRSRRPNNRDAHWRMGNFHHLVTRPSKRHGVI